MTDDVLIDPTRKPTRAEEEEDEEEEEEQEASGPGRPSEFVSRGLMKARTILISDPIDHKVTSRVISQLLMLDAESQDEPIRLYINSPGGSADDGFAIYDMIRFVRPKVKVVSVGLAASAATVIMMGLRSRTGLPCPTPGS